MVREDTVQNYFIRFVFGKRRPEDTVSLWEMSVDTRMKPQERSGGGGGEGEEEEEDSTSTTIGPIRIVHKEHESISAFCVNQV